MTTESEAGREKRQHGIDPQSEIVQREPIRMCVIGEGE